ncbi:rare lipoprotein A [Catenovulum agarivorans DS-2]|uniref:Endolytic peptidoglycan transglycosylase RlpA n=2 Tax=Catenovulum agarivorans TaxID=1172192 RepID=W7QJN8_9ALTE|nr:septal ring lytic transglycosylase RlpA family protein [Catenovulum agarivorans]EWH08353.1 rare lipoprotein A [Catenovulum agarivorans DS-2]
MKTLVANIGWIRFIGCTLLLLSGCQATQQSDSRYTIKQDTAPTRVPLAHETIDPTPIYEQPSRGGNKNYTVWGKDYQVLPTAEGFIETGIASWYGKKFHGHLTSNGEVYDMYSMSAAHKNLPLPTYVRVTNLDNGRKAVVRVNDRGPFHPGRIIDLSYAAAYKLGVTQTGTAKVKIEALHSAPGYYIQVEKGQLKNTLEEKSTAIAALFQLPTKIVENSGTFHLIAGPMEEQAQAQQLVADLIRSGYVNAQEFTNIRPVHELPEQSQ